MSGPTSSPGRSSEPSRTVPRTSTRIPDWVLIVVLLVAIPLLASGALEIDDYVVAHTTVTIDVVNWAVNVSGTTEYSISCAPGYAACPNHAKPGSEYFTSLVISPYYMGKALSLSVPAPFELVAPAPGVWSYVSGDGAVISVTLRLPGVPGVYSMTGTISTR